MKIVDYVLLGLFFAALLGLLFGFIYLVVRLGQAWERRQEAKERRAEEQAEEKWREMPISHMRNSFGVLSVYWKALWMTILFIFGPLALAILVTWLALSERVEWWLLAFAIFLWLSGGFAIWAFSDTVWDVWRDVFGGGTTVTGLVSGKRITKRTAQGATFKDYNIAVKSHDFEVCRRIYLWLSKGDTVVVHFWSRSETVARVDMISRGSPG